MFLTETIFRYFDEMKLLGNDPNYNIMTDMAVTNGLFSSSLAIYNINTSLAGRYRCQFDDDDDDGTFSSQGDLVVRIVKRYPTEDTVYSYTNSHYELNCSVDASDMSWNSSANVTWYELKQCLAKFTRFNHHVFTI